MKYNIVYNDKTIMSVWTSDGPINVMTNNIFEEFDTLEDFQTRISNLSLIPLDESVTQMINELPGMPEPPHVNPWDNV